MAMFLAHERFVSNPWFCGDLRKFCMLAIRFAASTKRVNLILGFISRTIHWTKDFCFVAFF